MTTILTILHAVHFHMLCQLSDYFFSVLGDTNGIPCLMALAWMKVPWNTTPLRTMASCAMQRESTLHIFWHSPYILACHLSNLLVGPWPNNLMSHFSLGISSSACARFNTTWGSYLFSGSLTSDMTKFRYHSFLHWLSVCLHISETKFKVFFALYLVYKVSIIIKNWRYIRIFNSVHRGHVNVWFQVRLDHDNRDRWHSFHVQVIYTS